MVTIKLNPSQTLHKDVQNRLVFLQRPQLDGHNQLAAACYPPVALSTLNLDHSRSLLHVCLNKSSNMHKTTEDILGV